jgi:hypothetical protein
LPALNRHNVQTCLLAILLTALLAILLTALLAALSGRHGVFYNLVAVPSCRQN